MSQNKSSPSRSPHAQPEHGQTLMSQRYQYRFAEIGVESSDLDISGSSDPLQHIYPETRERLIEAESKLKSVFLRSISKILSEKDKTIWQMTERGYTQHEIASAVSNNQSSINKRLFFLRNKLSTLILESKDIQRAARVIHTILSHQITSNYPRMPYYQAIKSAFPSFLEFEKCMTNISYAESKTA